MSMRIVLSRLLHHGRIFLRRYRPNQEVAEFAEVKILPRRGQVEAARSSVSPVNSPGAEPPRWQSHLISARKHLVESVLKRVTNSLAADLRRRTAKQLFFGNSTPFFALVGVSLASGTGIITKEDELDGVCWEIREAVSRMQTNMAKAERELFTSDEISLDNFQVGPVIAKGSNAVVYAARIKEDPASPTLCLEQPVTTFPFAVKMMFNYNAESNATSILRAMYRETIPARCRYSNPEIVEWEEMFTDYAISLPAHPNIVAMYCVFADRIPDIPGSRSLYPDALPSRINPDGCGRNMSLFLLMKRYDINLKSYISEKRPDVRNGILLLTQLLEAVAHLNKYQIAHRDLKSDNILLEMSEDNACPLLVVTDFGCCLADKSNGLSMPFRTLDTDKGGNATLMAPEVACALPGLFSYINYSKADVWAVGSIGYELLTDIGNPFYKTNKNSIRNTTYTEEELPRFGEEVPDVIVRLIQALVIRNPSKRPSAEIAATVCHLFLWAPCAWIQHDQSKPLPSSSEILQWLLCLTTKVLCEGRLNTGSCGSRRTEIEYQLIASFLRRINLSIIRQALVFIQQGA